MRIRVGLSPVLGLAFIAVAVLDAYEYALDGEGLQLALGAVMLLVGVTYLLATLLVVDGDRVEVKNPFGMNARTYPFTALDVTGRTLWVTLTDGTRRPIRGWFANRSHWRALADAVRSAPR